MRHIKFSEEIDTFHRRLPFFLATEEWVARYLPADEYFFSWQVDPTVICGRNQDIEKEVNLDYCRRNGIDVVRRRSGGGAVFADRENFMFSYITAGDNVTAEFARYTAMVANALCRLGMEAVPTGRNDIVIRNRKVSGNAFYHIPGRCIAHGTMLYDFNIDNISGALTPSRAKLESKKVKSVESRVTSLKIEGIALPPSEFEKFMIAEITDSNPYIITDYDLKLILEIEANYYLPSFLGIREVGEKKDAPEPDSLKIVSNHVHLDGVGEFCVDYTVDSLSRIRGLRISGDFFMRDDVEKQICGKLEGITLNRDALCETIKEIDPPSVIEGLSAEMLLNLIVGQ